MPDHDRVRVLIIDDDVELARALGRVLSGQFASKAINDPFEALAEIATDPDAFDVNIRCLDGDAMTHFVITPFDGEHWEANVDAIR